MTWSLYTCFLPTDWISQTFTCIKEIAQSFSLIPSYYSPNAENESEHPQKPSPPVSAKAKRDKKLGKWKVSEILVVLFIISFAMFQVYTPTRYIWDSHHRGLWVSDNSQLFHWRMMMINWETIDQYLEVVDPVSHEIINVIPLNEFKLGGNLHNSFFQFFMLLKEIF